MKLYSLGGMRRPRDLSIPRMPLHRGGKLSPDLVHQLMVKMVGPVHIAVKRQVVDTLVWTRRGYEYHPEQITQRLPKATEEYP